ncbi:MAG: hypothetical protein ACUVWX_14010 [Kiritimatiellia bacterium]
MKRYAEWVLGVCLAILVWSFSSAGSTPKPIVVGLCNNGSYCTVDTL